jgi:hypothetical protein
MLENSKENSMKRWFLFGSLTLALALFLACGSDSTNKEESMQGDNGMGSMQKSDSMKSSEEWIRSEPVDVHAIDANQDGYVYQDQMDWNVIADEEGKCPKCGMVLKKVTVDEAIQKLKDNGFTVK